VGLDGAPANDRAEDGRGSSGGWQGFRVPRIAFAPCGSPETGPRGDGGPRHPTSSTGHRPPARPIGPGSRPRTGPICRAGRPQTRTSITLLLTGPLDLTEGLLAVKQGSGAAPPRMTPRWPGGQLGGRVPCATGDQPVALHTLPRTRARSGPVVARLRTSVGSIGGRLSVVARAGATAPPAECDGDFILR